MSIDIITRDTSDNGISAIDFGEPAPGETSSEVTVRFYNNGDSTPAEMLIGCITSAFNFTGDRNNQGQEAVTEQWVEAKEGAGAWTAIGGDPLTGGNTLSATAPSAGNYTDIVFRLVVPSGADTRGRLAVFPFAFYPTE